MSKLLMCRICLIRDVRMYSLYSTRLQGVYEDLTARPLQTEDNRPMLACYICHARLERCYRLRMDCLQSEKYFAHVLSSNASDPGCAEDICNSNKLKITSVIHLSMGNVVEKTDCAIKVEPPDTDAVAEEDPGPVFLNTSDESQQQYCVELEVVKVEPGDIMTDGAQEEIPAVSPRNLESAQVDDKKNKTVCDKKKISKSHEHDKNENSDKKMYQCEVCLIFFSSVNSLTIHNRRVHSAKVPYPCNVCHKSYGSISHLNRHISTVHAAKNRYQCNICIKNYNSKDSLNKHINVEHTDEKPYQSNVCHKIDNKPNFYKHILEIEKSYECNICLKSLSSKSGLRNHIYLAHIRSRKFSCDVCKKDFSSRSSIMTHMRTHTGEKPYLCKVCEKSFSDMSTLKKHILVHGDEKPFRCDKCDKGFRRKDHLETHLRLHTGDKPYQCDVCNLRFTQRIHLRDHHRIHTGQKPFSCSLCNNSFSHKSCLTRHMSRVHKRSEK